MCDVVDELLKLKCFQVEYFFDREVIYYNSKRYRIAIVQNNRIVNVNNDNVNRIINWNRKNIQLKLSLEELLLIGI